MGANISLIGNLGKEPETKITDNGTFMASFSMASNTVRNTKDGKVKKTDWFRVTAFGKQAETIARYVRKGHRLYVQGRLTFQPWLDNEEKPQSGAEIALQEFQFLNDKREDNDSEEAAAVIPSQMDAPAEIAQTAAY
ncbi:MAG: single-stranded DNA-binding protein [Acidobacteria bacterium]|nr:single-stranded DNA-binding protein [Acidobacteriota bacterium]